MKTLTPEDARKNVGLPFVPAIEDDFWDASGAPFEREERFITEQPRDLMKRGAFNKLPYITGYNSHEAMLFLRSKFNWICRKQETAAKCEFCKRTPTGSEIVAGHRQ